MITNDQATKLRKLIDSKVAAEHCWGRTTFQSRDNELRWRRLQKATIELDKFIVGLTEKDETDGQRGHHARR